MRIKQHRWALALVCSLIEATTHFSSSLAQDYLQSTPQARTAGLIEASGIEFDNFAFEDGKEASPSDRSSSAESNNEDSRVTGSDKVPQDKEGNKAKELERESIAPVQSRLLSNKIQTVSISIDKLGTGVVPKPSATRESASHELPTGAARGMFHTHVYWKASLIQHYPLYFEDAMLERHGHTRCWNGCALPQSIVSGVKFFATIPLLPYHETLRHKHQCVYALGHYRPGSTAPCLRDNIPYDHRAFAVESAAAAAFFWATPL